MSAVTLAERVNIHEGETIWNETQRVCSGIVLLFVLDC